MKDSIKAEMREERMEHSSKMKSPKLHAVGKKKGMGKMVHMAGKK